MRCEKPGSQRGVVSCHVVFFIHTAARLEPERGAQLRSLTGPGPDRVELRTASEKSKRFLLKSSPSAYFLHLSELPHLHRARGIFHTDSTDCFGTCSDVDPFPHDHRLLLAENENWSAEDHMSPIEGEILYTVHALQSF